MFNNDRKGNEYNKLGEISIKKDKYYFNPNKKELSSNLTGYEETGLIYQKQSWQVIDISTLNLIPLEDTEKKIKSHDTNQ